MTEVEVPVPEAIDAVRRPLLARSVPAATADAIAERLVSNERDGYRGHGLIRAAEYAAAIDAGEIDPGADPVTSEVGSAARLIDGRRCLGILAERELERQVGELLADGPVGVVGLRDAGHLGRLGPLAARVAGRGDILLGFVNYRGFGLKVAPYGGGEPRLASNPIVAGFPRLGGPPLVADFSTSATSEGDVRGRALAGRAAEAGWLLDADGNDVLDATALYADPPSAMLAPLGGAIAGHKGYALALVVDILAGIVAGAGRARPSARGGGNGGLFIALKPDVLGRTGEDVAAEVDALAAWCAGAAPSDPVRPVRVPGDRPAGDPRAPLRLDRAAWEAILRIPLSADA